MMKSICILGANGQTGQEIVKQALRKNYAVRGVVRRADSLSEYRDQIEVVEYSLDDPLSVQRAVTGADIVISAIGSGGGSEAAKPTELYSTSVRILLSAMRETGILRLLVLSSGGVDYDAQAPWYYRKFFRPWLMNTYMDMMKMETLLEAAPSELAWTIVRPTYLLNGSAKPYLVADRKVGRGNFKIHRTDVADFILKEIEQSEWLRRYPTLGYP
ncbi:NAD(P)-dependent oxidoreductase [Tunicatimonas pelagia]|uniref:NAD(P)-dependent oxidoreductase n=1 Tax=Tunicatimonas pelagia TaxID=931531 RepID=UPI002666D825|nr:NAD(P)H-binding protein [Tunicatimonas pelagia]WKN42771.1 NAD(P)H-binding protein [Tunicatimonas pelagia]